ncbi:hypothetical protein AALO_G00029190 [Alosa alosa]|uniref:Chemokine interleukin-8-like domain-containing protein n=1 Tax=Alosa alosa TaxID=278164 RepID=A0AAV6HC43_9TELE|nr:C-C motif chemokine 18-like [Alosa alosa]KAG5284669.1 hypothetical protein AALO_G00029190 [Alosa alosa]
MKTTCMCLALALVIMMAVTSEAFIYSLETTPKGCCFKFLDASINIPKSDIISAEKTDPKCPKPAIVVTVPGRDFCVSPTSRLGKRLAAKVNKN